MDFYRSHTRYYYTVKRLISLGTDINQWTSDKCPPLVSACKYGELDTVELLLSHGSNTNLTDAYGTSALMYASMYGYTDCIQVLLSHGANVNQCNRNNDTALTNMLFGYVDDQCSFEDPKDPLMPKDLEIVKLLIAHGGNVNHSNEWGENIHNCTRPRVHKDVLNYCRQISTLV